MTSRQRVIMALNFTEPDKVPVTLAYETPDDLCRKYNKPEFIGQFRNDLYSVNFKELEPSFEIRERCARIMPKEAIINQWGIGTIRSETGESYKVYSPLADMNKLEEIDAYPFPNVDDQSLFSHLDKDVTQLHSRGYAVQGAMSQTIFEFGWHLVGMEKLMIDFYENPRFINRLFDIITDMRIKMALRYVAAGVDILRLGDDIGSQNGMMISPLIWRTFIKPRLAVIISKAKSMNNAFKVFYHSDGDIRAVIPELIEIGVDILNPVQPECMDPAEIKKKYGDRLSILGGLGTQTTMPFGKPQEVKNVVKTLCEEIGKGGGFIIAPSHSLERDVPWENIAAFYEAVEEFGVY